MSASLVGSEMCIRDRLQPRGCESRLGPGFVALRAAGSLPSSERGSDPVSYTHLTLPTICSV
eukprot:3058954-Alexandrium_andersonii.AAC.1